MNRRLASLMLCLSLALPGAAYSADAMSQALSTIPADAMGFVCVPSLKQLDADYQDTINTLALQMFVQPPANSLVTLLKQKMPLLEGMDENRPLTVVFMPVETIDQLSQSMVIQLWAAEPKVIIEAMQGQPGEGGVWTVNLMGQPAYAAIDKNRLIVAPTADLVKAVKDSKSGIDGKLKPEELKSLEGLDVAIWFGGDQLTKLVKPWVDGFILPMMMMQSAQGPFEAASAEMNKKNIEMLVNGASSMGMGLALDKGGLGLRFLMTSKPGTELANRMKVKQTTGTLLQGLPAGEYMLAIGQITDPAATKASLGDLDAMFGLADDVEGLDKEKVTQLKNVLHEWAPMATGFRLAIEALTPGPEGLFGVSFIVDTTDANRWLQHAATTIDLAKQIIAGLATDDSPEGEPGKMDEDVKKILDAITHNAAAEEVGGLKVQHLKFDIAKIEEVDEEDWEQINKVVGKDGALLRMAPLGADKVVVTFGGGRDYLARLIEQAKKKDAPLDNDAGIKKVATYLPKDRGSVGYLAVDQVVVFIKNVMKALDEEVIPVQFPDLDAPMALSGSGGDGWVRGDLFIPAELMIAAKDAGMGLMGAMMAPPGAEPPPTTETPPTSE